MTKSRANEIDLLRFIAAIAVVLFHYTFRGYLGGDHMTSLRYPWLEPVSKYGYLGVDLFFIISGFVILMTASSSSVREFVASRIARLYPAFWACCLLTFLCSLMIGTPKTTVTVPQFAANMTMLSGFAFIPFVDGSYWSLLVELRFYVLVGVLLVLGQIKRAELFMWAWLAVTVLLDAFPINILKMVLVTNYSAYFIAGAAFYLVWKSGTSASRVMLIVLAWLLSLRHALYALPAFEKQFTTTTSPAVVGATVTAFFLVMSLIAAKRTGWIGRRSWMAGGALTYPLYLVHQFVGYMIFNALSGLVNVHLLVWGTFGGMLVIAYMVNRYVERRYAGQLRSMSLSTLDAPRRMFTAARLGSGR